MKQPLHQEQRCGGGGGGAEQEPRQGGEAAAYSQPGPERVKPYSLSGRTGISTRSSFHSPQPDPVVRCSVYRARAGHQAPRRDAGQMLLPV